MSITPLTPAQQAQQNNRTGDGKYTEKAHPEDDGFTPPFRQEPDDFDLVVQRGRAAEFVAQEELAEQFDMFDITDGYAEAFTDTSTGDVGVDVAPKGQRHLWKMFTGGEVDDFRDFNYDSVPDDQIGNVDVAALLKHLEDTDPHDQKFYRDLVADRPAMLPPRFESGNWQVDDTNIQAGGDVSLGDEYTVQRTWVMPDGTFFEAERSTYVTSKAKAPAWDADGSTVEWEGIKVPTGNELLYDDWLAVEDKIGELTEGMGNKETARFRSNAPVRFSVQVSESMLNFTSLEDRGGSETGADVRHSRVGQAEFTTLAAAEAEARKRADATDWTRYIPREL